MARNCSRGASIYRPADTVVTLEEGRIRLRALPNGESDHGLIDSFFVSMAHDQDGNVIGLIMGRFDGDGTLGTAAIKECGGLALAVDDASLHGLDLRSASNPAAITDHIPAAATIDCTHRCAHAASPRLRSSGTAGRAQWQRGDKLSQIAAILRNTTGHDFSRLQTRHVPASRAAAHAGRAGGNAGAVSAHPALPLRRAVAAVQRPADRRDQVFSRPPRIRIARAAGDPAVV